MKLSLYRFPSKVKLFLSIFLFLIISLGIQGNRTNYVLAQDRTTTFDRAETLNLKRQIRQLEAEIRRLQQSNRRSNSLIPYPTPRATVGNPPIIDNRPIGRSDPMFERLATLLIELKEDVHNLDKRITAIEEKINLR